MDSERVFQELVDSHYPSLYRFALSLSRNENDALDLAQQTFLLWARKGGELRDPSKAKSWLFTTLHREFLQRQRKLTRFRHQELSEVEGELPAVEAADRSADGYIALEALRQLDPDFRVAVALFYLEDFTQQEIANVLEIPLGTVKSRISRGVAQLHQALGSSEFGAKKGIRRD